MRLDSYAWTSLCQWCHARYDSSDNTSDATMMAIAVSDWLERIDAEDAEHAIAEGWPRCVEIFSSSEA